MNAGKGRSSRPRAARSAGPAKVRLPPPPIPRERPRAAGEVPEVAPEHVQMEVSDDERARRQRRPAPAPTATARPSRPGDRPARRGPSNREVLRRALSAPGAARQAFLLREVLGPPVSMRTGTDDRPSEWPPGWSLGL